MEYLRRKSGKGTIKREKKQIYLQIPVIGRPKAYACVALRSKNVSN